MPEVSVLNPSVDMCFQRLNCKRLLKSHQNVRINFVLNKNSCFKSKNKSKLHEVICWHLDFYAKLFLIFLFATNLIFPDEIAVIDEIQMIRDPQRGWAWTRALLGLQAEEIHLCGEAGAINLIKEIALTTDEDVEVRKYKRLTALKVEESAVGECL